MATCELLSTDICQIYVYVPNCYIQLLSCILSIAFTHFVPPSHNLWPHVKELKSFVYEIY